MFRKSQLPFAMTIIAASLSHAMIAHADTAVTPEATLPTVTVNTTVENAGATQNLQKRSGNGALGTRSQLETPFTTTVVTQSDLQARQVTSLGDIFKYDAAVVDSGMAYNGWASYITVRGLALDWQNSYKIDGKPFMNFRTVLPVEQLEQVQLLKGLSGFMYGFAQPGGIVNYVTKKPTDTPVRSVDVGFKSGNIWSQHVDLGGRVGEDGRFGYRINASHESGRTADDGRINRNAVSVALDARLTDKLTWDFQSLYQQRNASDAAPSLSIWGYTDSLLPVTMKGGDVSNFRSKGQYTNSELQFYSTGLAYQLNNDWRLSTYVSHAKNTLSLSESTVTLANAQGDYYPDSRYNGNDYNVYDNLRVMLEGRAHTGSITHDLVVGVEWQKETDASSWNSTGNASYATVGTGGNIYTPTGNSYYGPDNYPAVDNSKSTQTALFASDTIKLNDAWSVLAGARVVNYKQETLQTAQSTASTYEKNGVLSPTFAVMYNLQPTTTLYASFVKSLKQGATVGSAYANRGVQLSPLTSKQYEFGIKSLQDTWSATAAVFRMEQGSEYADANTNLVQDGLSVYEGIEFGGAVKLAKQWTLNGNVMFLDAKYDKGQANIGKKVIGAPDAVVTARVDYDVASVAGLSLNAGAKYVGKTMLRADNTLSTSPYTTADVGAVYKTRIGGYATTFTANINNVTDKKHWDYVSENYIKAASPRTYSVNAKVEF
jgi:iron complex outermembrane receptor protein